jgi:hypothetical protein
MTRLNRLLYLCVGAAWAAAGLTWVGAGLVMWDGNKFAFGSAVDSAVGAVMAATIFTAAVGWFAWKRLN